MKAFNGMNIRAAYVVISVQVVADQAPFNPLTILVPLYSTYPPAYTYVAPLLSRCPFPS